VIDSHKEKNIGVLEISLNSLIDAQDMSVEQPFPLRDSGYESSVVCELKLRVCYLLLLLCYYCCVVLCCVVLCCVVLCCVVLCCVVLCWVKQSLFARFSYHVNFVSLA
jgi:hypothetical protein